MKCFKKMKLRDLSESWELRKQQRKSFSSVKVFFLSVAMGVSVSESLLIFQNLTYKFLPNTHSLDFGEVHETFQKSTTWKSVENLELFNLVLTHVRAHSHTHFRRPLKSHYKHASIFALLEITFNFIVMLISIFYRSLGMLPQVGPSVHSVCVILEFIRVQLR